MRREAPRLKRAIRRSLAFFGLEARPRFPFLGRRFAYVPPTRPARHLEPEFFAPTVLDATNGEPPGPPGELYSIWRDIPGGHKWRHYFETYESVASSFRHRPIRMLEIGVYKGGSARMWQRYLHPESVVVGLDIDPDCKRYEDPGANLFIRIGDQSDPQLLRGLVEEFGPFDFVLDDGSHRCSDMIASFCHLFLDGLASPGVYLAEDTHASFWDANRDQSYSFVDLAKDLVDLMHSHYFRNQSEDLFRQGGPARVTAVAIPRITAEIEEIVFRDSLVVIRKATRSALPFTELL